MVDKSRPGYFFLAMTLPGIYLVLFCQQVVLYMRTYNRQYVHEVPDPVE